MSLSSDLRQKIDEIVASDEVVLFMKGTRIMPQCGFSATVVNILDDMVPNYRTINVLADMALREGIKEYSNWPTIPQLYVKGEFIGGCDIVRQLHASGELHSLLGAEKLEAKTPALQISDAAIEELRRATTMQGGGDVRLQINPQFNYELYVDQPEESDVIVEVKGLRILITGSSVRRADGMKLDFVKGPDGKMGFRIENPNEPSSRSPGVVAN